MEYPNLECKCPCRTVVAVASMCRFVYVPNSMEEQGGIASIAGAALPPLGLRSAVLRFVRLFQDQHNGWSPSLGQIAIGVRASKTQVSRVLDRLESEGLLARLPASPRRPRPIVLPDAQARAIALLQALGWSVNEQERLAVSPEGAR